MYTYNEPTLINSEKTDTTQLLPVNRYGEKIHTCFLSALNSPPPPILLDIPIYTPDTSCDSLT